MNLNFLISALVRGERSGFAPVALTPEEEHPYQLDRKLDGPYR
jgi:hypothetical protein